MISHILNKKPHDGLVDQFKEVRLRIGIIENPTIARKKDSKIDPLDPIGAVNISNGMVCVKWIDEQGGVIRGDSFKGKAEITASATVDGTRVTDVKEDKSNREMITLTHPMIWANDKNWCGMHYLPPVGSIVIVGFKRHGFPVILGYLQSNYKICNPIKLGEMMIKGYGKNYIHWKQSARLEAKVWANKGDVDLDSVAFSKKNDSSITINMKFDAHDGFMKFGISNDKSQSTTFNMTPNSLSLVSTGDVTIKAKNVHINP